MNEQQAWMALFTALIQSNEASGVTFKKKAFHELAEDADKAMREYNDRYGAKVPSRVSATISQ